ncbi:MAG: PAS domain S-box protein [Proteobacteria bacterium]|nr:MAG: PAS domain S-box protein [Pseudomonadota bacterium]
MKSSMLNQLPLLQASLNGSRDGILVVDFRQNKALDYNRRFLEIWNIDQEQSCVVEHEFLMARIVEQTIETEQLRTLTQSLCSRSREESLDRIELKCHRFIEMHSSASIIDDEVCGRVCFFRDITAEIRQKSIEEARTRTMTLIAMGAELEQILESIVHGVEGINPNMICSILLLDRGQTHLTVGSAPNLPKFYNQAINGLKIGPEVGCCGAAAYSKKRVVVENIMDNSFWTPYRPLAVAAGLSSCWSEPIIDPDRNVLGTFAIYHRFIHSPSEADIITISEAANIAAIAIHRKRVEEDIISQERRFRSLFEGSNDAIILVGKDGVFDCNRRAPEMFGLSSKEELFQSKVFELSPDEQPDGQSSLLSSQYHLMQGYQEGNHQFEWSYRSAKGREFPAEVILKSYLFEGQRVLQFTIRDISERKSAETAFNCQREKLVAASKLSSLVEMAGGIAHEINNPLAIIIGQASRIRRRYERGLLDTEQLGDDLVRIESTAQRIAKIVRGLRSFSRSSEKDPMEVTSVTDIIEDTLELCQEKFRVHAIELILDVAPDIRLSCRRSQIAQLLMNLLSNAYDAVDDLSSKWIKLEAYANEEWITIEVSDSGEGIDPAIREKIMQPFFTTKEEGRGTGLGLSISQGISEDHGGSLRLEPSAEHTTFIVRLPLFEEDRRQQESTSMQLVSSNQLQA